MKNLKLFTAITAFFFLLFFGCKEDVESPPAYNPYPDLAEVDSIACDPTPLTNWLFQEYFSWGGV